ncbi:MAG: Ig-like domain-containing protein [Clostridia bacterium]|nr:Ig-like domain-containing protein [Clostridia bacterium]
MKKLFLIVCTLCLSLALAFGFAACGETNQGDPSVIPVVSVGLNKTTLELETGDTYIIIATVMPSNATDKTVTWSSSNPSVATVSDGKITAVAVGTAEITATSGSREATCSVTVKQKVVETVPVVSITLNEENLDMEVGDTFDLITTILPANATDRTVSWSSSSACVSVSDKGRLTAKSAGEAIITATADGKSATCKVTVTRKVEVEEVTLDKTTLDLFVGDTSALVATVAPSDATNATLSWESSNAAVATVENGVVTAKAVGSAQITVTAGGKTATCTVNVSAKVVPVTAVSLDKTSVSLKVGSTTVIRATVTPENATDVMVDWSSSNEAVATVVNGAVLAKAAGTVTITATVSGKSATCIVTVTADTTVAVTGVTLNKSTLELKEGANSTLTATISPANATETEVVWTSSNQAVATVVNGVVTAKKEGTATVTATVGGKSATCTVTVTAATVEATSVTLNKTDLELKEGETFTLTATIAPSNSTENEVIWTSSDTSVATVADGVVTAKKEGTATITAKVGKVTAVCEVGVIKETVEPIDPVIPDGSIITYAHAGEESAAFEWKDTNAAGAKVEYKLSTVQSSYTAIDKQLIRQISAQSARADILGLKGGVKYDFKITSSDKKVSTVSGVQISSLDRSGYAHHNNEGIGVGAYNDDGTLKSNAIIVYVTEATKNAVVVNGSATTQSIAEYLTSAKNNKNPIVVRIIGTVGAATWKEGNVTYTKTDDNTDDSGNLLPEAVVGKDGQSLDKKGWSQADLISGGYNELDKSVYAELRGLSSSLSWNSSKNEYDSCWNDCQVKNVKNLTVEGVGEDAQIFQWGFTFKSCNSIEVRNLKFDDYTEDACSVEGGSSNTSTNDPDGFTYKRFWIHHNTFEEGVNYWDVCKEQDKHDGDGSTDFKYISYVTVSYNQYNNTHKTGLIGGDDKVNSANFTFHHNYYNQCSQRMPLGRQANIHIYNNYFYKSGLYSISLRASAYAYIENCVFTSGVKTGDYATKPIELVKGSQGVPSCKVINCEMEGTIANGITDVNNLYVGNDTTKTVTGDNRYGLNFEQDTGFYTVTNKLATNEVAAKIPTLAGTQKRASNIKIEGGSEEEEKPGPSNEVTMNVGVIANAGNLTIGTEQNFDNVELADGIVINTTGNKTKVTANGNNFDDESSFTHRIVMKSPGNYFKITVDKACTIKVYVANGSSTDTTGRLLGLYTDAAGNNLLDGTSTTRLLGGEKQIVEYTVTAGTYYLESPTNELSFYCIKLIYS